MPQKVNNLDMKDSRERGHWEAGSLGKSQGRMLGEGAANDEALGSSEGWRQAEKGEEDHFREKASNSYVSQLSWRPSVPHIQQVWAQPCLPSQLVNPFPQPPEDAQTTPLCLL